MSSNPKSLVFEGQQEEKTASELSSYARRTQPNAPLFNLIVALKKESNPLATQLKSIASSTAFLLEINPSSFLHTPLFPENQYQLTARHFRIDQYCKINEGSRHGLSPIHYTEKYACNTPKNTPYIVVHGYLNTQGHYLYCQIKTYQDEARQHLSPIQITTEEMLSIEQRIIININAARIPLDLLLTEKKKRAFDLKITADKREQVLSALSQSLQSEGLLGKYIGTANLFVKDIIALNQYSDISDPRGTVIQKALCHLTERSICLRTLNPSKIKIPQTEITAETQREKSENTQNTQNSPQPTLETTQITEMITTLEKHATQNNLVAYNIFKPNLEAIINAHPLIAEIERDLWFVVFLPKIHSAEQTKRLDELYQKISLVVEHHNQQCLAVFDFGARSGNLDTAVSQVKCN